MGPLDAVRAVLGAILLAWLPGYVWTRVLVPDLGTFPRHVLAVALSVSSISLALFLGNVLAGIPVSGLTAGLEATTIAAAGAALLWRRGRVHATA